jgi:hypothetical protein
MTTTLASMLREMKTWMDIPAETIKSAEESGISTKNSKDLKSLVDGWSRGRYDEDPGLLTQSLIRLIPKAK